MPDLTRRHLLQASAGAAVAAAAVGALPGVADAAKDPGPGAPGAGGSPGDDGLGALGPVIAEVTGDGEVTVYAGDGAAVVRDRDLANKLTAAARQAAKG